ncbi:hypothetical protein Cadr_000027771 [Camelus dromedarius]|uniref:Uncharacterized protein n=1 Tax=Camelus dromedarius TaxID=9838 RepID=A0A5N4CBU0_CAMDR|nr:hypothetical protein Cadr_000027771 [Camelus dromedarius]
MQEAPCPGYPHQNATEPLAHDRRVVQRFADGHIAVIGHGREDNHLCSSKEPSKEMVFLSERESTIIFGAMAEEKHASKTDRKAKKKYMGEPRSAGLLLMVTTISKLPPIVVM